ncbi:MAG: hypothetical protein V3U19_07395 [Thermodesulfobacteriota bacterium]|jgi:hypothetical protein
MTDPYNNKITRQLDIDRYYYYLNMITENVRNGYNNMVIKYCELSLPLIPLLIEKTKKDFGEFDISSIPAIELGAKLWSYQHNLEKIKEIEKLIDTHSELEPWRIHLVRAYERLNSSVE